MNICKLTQNEWDRVSMNINVWKGFVKEQLRQSYLQGLRRHFDFPNQKIKGVGSPVYTYIVDKQVLQVQYGVTHLELQKEIDKEIGDY